LRKNAYATQQATNWEIITIWKS